MKILLQDQETKLYCCVSPDWTADRRMARGFAEIYLARQFAREKGLLNMQVVLSYDDPLCDLVLPFLEIKKTY